MFFHYIMFLLAIETQEAFIMIIPMESQLWFRRLEKGKRYYFLGRFDAAESHLRAATKIFFLIAEKCVLDIFPIFRFVIEAHWFLGLTYESMGRKRDAFYEYAIIIDHSQRARQKFFLLSRELFSP